MKLFTYSTRISPAWKIEAGPGGPALLLGEQGRGRRLARVPVAAELAAELVPAPAPRQPTTLEVADLERRGGTIIVLPGRDSAPRTAGLVIRDQSGYRGSWTFGTPAPKVLAEGRKAYGIAGNVGGGPEILLTLGEGEEVEIVRSGRLYGAPSRVWLRWDGSAMTVESSQDRAARLDAGRPASEVW